MNYQTDYADYLDTLPPYIKAFMTSQLPIFDAQVVLLELASELDDNYSPGPIAEALKSSLGRLCLLDIPTFI